MLAHQDNSVEMSSDDGEPATSSLESSELNSTYAESPVDDSSEGTFSDAVESIDEQSSETSSDMPEDIPEDDGPSDVSSPDYADFGLEMVDGNVAIAFSPDYILFRDIYCTDSKVTFTENCVKVNGSTAHGNKQIFSIEVAIDDVVEIQSQWCGKFEMAEVTLFVIVRDSVGDDANGSSGIEKLEFIVVDSYWHHKTEAILSLNVKYKALWNVTIDTETHVDQEDLLGKRPMLLPKRYFPIFDENFEEVIYPQGDIDAVSISMHDVDLLKPDTFINDTIIDFYIKYLKNKILPEEKHKFHFFNCFFFRKLADMDKDPSSALEGRAAFLRVRKWTRKVNLFDKDFIFIPVNYNYHWSLIVICHPCEIANIRDEDIAKAARVPCILHMDSLRGSHVNLKDLFQSYLLEEWKERQKSAVEDTSSKFLNLRFVSLELPQQQNLYDCGLFLLHYVERFLEDAPANFSPFRITKLSKFLTVRWFPTAEPSIKRGVIHRLIYDLLNKCSQSPSGKSVKWCPSNNPRTSNDNENDLERFTKRSGPSKDDRAHLINSDGEQGVEMDLLQSSSFRGPQSTVDSGLVMRDLFEPITSAASLLDMEYQAFGRTTSFNEFHNGLPPIEEEVEADMHFVHTTLAESGFQQLDVVEPEASALQYEPKDYRSEPACDPASPIEEKDDAIGPSSGKSTCDSENISEVEIAENSRVRETNLDDKVDPQIPPVSPENIYRLQTHDEATEVAGSQSPTQLLVPSTCIKNLPISSDQKDDNNVQENDGILCDTIQSDADDLDSDSDMHRAAKKMRLSCPSEVGIEFSNTTLSNDLHL